MTAKQGVAPIVMASGATSAAFLRKRLVHSFTSRDALTLSTGDSAVLRCRQLAGCLASGVLFLAGFMLRDIPSDISRDRRGR